MPMLIGDSPCCADSCRSPPQFQTVCRTCKRLFCSDHEKSIEHACTLMTNDERELLEEMIDKSIIAAHLANVAATPLRSAALAIRKDAKSCTVTLPEERAWGSFNVHVDVVFDDGVRWLARTRLAGPECGNKAWRRLTMLSDFATMSVLNLIVPEYVPRAWYPRCSNDPIDYFFVEWVEGEIADEDEPFKQTTIEDFADLLIKLVSNPFKGVGSFNPYTTADVVHSSSPELSGNAVMAGLEPADVENWQPGPLVGVYSWNSSKPLGPFRTSQEAYLAMIDDVLQQLETGQTYIPISHRVHAYLVHLEMRALVSGCEEMAIERPTYLRHGDDKADSLLLKEDARIAGVIDWEFAYTAPLPEAVAWATLMDIRKFNVCDDLSDAEKRLQAVFVARGRPDLAEALNGSRKYMRLRKMLGALFTPAPWTNPRAVNNLRRSFLGDKAGPQPKTFREWWAMALDRYREDPGLQRLQRKLEEMSATQSVSK